MSPRVDFDDDSLENDSPSRGRKQQCLGLISLEMMVFRK